MLLHKLLRLLTTCPLIAVGCVPPEGDRLDESASKVAPAAQGEVQLNLLYVHGLKSCRQDRLDADDSLDELQVAIDAELAASIAVYEADHPGATIVAQSAHASLYTAAPSPFHPSDSPDPINMDDWEAGDPGCNTSVQGEPCTTAYEWRYRLAEEIERLFPPDARNIILIGHSAGARAAFEVAANVGVGGVGTFDWGVQDRIAGVVSVQGMVDSLGTSKYDVAGPLSFVSSCKVGDIVTGFGSSCAPGNGFCEWASDISGFAAADWVAQHKQALMLISFASCSPSAFAGFTDGVLPLDAQGSPRATGIEMTAGPGRTFRPAHGLRYASVCHSDIVDPSKPGHVQAIRSARDQILMWLFDSAVQVAASGTASVSPIAFGQSSPTFTVGGACPSGHVDGSADVAGTCRHPGFSDGDDHPVAGHELSILDGSDCDGRFSWTQNHDQNNLHAGLFWWKTYSMPTGTGILPLLPAGQVAEP